VPNTKDSVELGLDSESNPVLDVKSENENKHELERQQSGDSDKESPLNHHGLSSSHSEEQGQSETDTSNSHEDVNAVSAEGNDSVAQNNSDSVPHSDNSESVPNGADVGSSEVKDNAPEPDTKTKTPQDQVQTEKEHSISQLSETYNNSEVKLNAQQQAKESSGSENDTPDKSRESLESPVGEDSEKSESNGTEGRGEESERVAGLENVPVDDMEKAASVEDTEANEGKEQTRTYSNIEQERIEADADTRGSYADSPNEANQHANSNVPILEVAEDVPPVKSVAEISPSNEQFRFLREPRRGKGLLSWVLLASLIIVAALAVLFKSRGTRSIQPMLPTSRFNTYHRMGMNGGLSR